MRTPCPTLLLPLLLVIGSTLAAQAPKPPEPVAMKPLAWIVGEWTGTGSMMTGPGTMSDASVHETATLHAGGHVLVLEGLGKAKVPGQAGETVVHNAFATIWYDADAKAYRMRAFRATGHAVDAGITVADKRIVWGFRDPRAGQIRFTVNLTDDGKWHEVGENSQDGTTWNRFFEMTLSRKAGS